MLPDHYHRRRIELAVLKEELLALRPIFRAVIPTSTTACGSTSVPLRRRTSCASASKSSGTRIMAKSRNVTRGNIRGSGAGMKKSKTSPGSARNPTAIAGTTAITRLSLRRRPESETTDEHGWSGAISLLGSSRGNEAQTKRISEPPHVGCYRSGNGLAVSRILTLLLTQFAGNRIVATVSRQLIVRKKFE